MLQGTRKATICAWSASVEIEWGHFCSFDQQSLSSAAVTVRAATVAVGEDCYGSIAGLGRDVLAILFAFVSGR